MLHLLLAAFLFQTLPTILPSSNVRESIKDGFPLVGQLHFEGGASPHIVTVELRDGVARNIVDETTTTPTGVFRFDGVIMGRYTIVIDSERYQYVQQLLVVDMQVFAMISLDIPMYPRRASEGGDALVSLEELRRNMPREALEEYDRAVEEFQDENSVRAVEHLERALKISPDFYEAHLQLGLAHQRDERRPEAIASLERAVELNDASAEGRSWLGRLYFETEQFVAAIEQLYARIDLGAPSADDYFFLGSSYYRLGALMESEDNLLRAVELEPDASGPVRLQLFNVYVRSGQTFKALDQLDTYLEAFPDAPNYDAIKERADQIRRDLGG